MLKVKLQALVSFLVTHLTSLYPCNHRFLSISLCLLEYYIAPIFLLLRLFRCQFSSNADIFQLCHCISPLTGPQSRCTLFRHHFPAEEAQEFPSSLPGWGVSPGGGWGQHPCGWAVPPPRCLPTSQRETRFPGSFFSTDPRPWIFCPVLLALPGQAVISRLGRCSG